MLNGYEAFFWVSFGQRHYLPDCVLFLVVLDSLSDLQFVYKYSYICTYQCLHFVNVNTHQNVSKINLQKQCWNTQVSLRNLLLKIKLLRSGQKYLIKHPPLIKQRFIKDSIQHTYEINIHAFHTFRYMRDISAYFLFI